MSTIIAISPLLLWIAILVIGFIVVRIMITRFVPKDLEKRVAELEQEVHKLKNKG